MYLKRIKFGFQISQKISDVMTEYSADLVNRQTDRQTVQCKLTDSTMLCVKPSQASWGQTLLVLVQSEVLMSYLDPTRSSLTLTCSPRRTLLSVRRPSPVRLTCTVAPVSVSTSWLMIISRSSSADQRYFYAEFKRICRSDNTTHNLLKKAVRVRRSLA